MEDRGRRATDRNTDRLAGSAWVVLAAGLVATALGAWLVTLITPDIGQAPAIVALTGIVVSSLCALATGVLIPASAARRSTLRRLPHDTLTGLPNRAGLDLLLAERVDAARRQGASVGVLYCDLDRFRMINDAVGRAAGDALLVEAGRRIAEAVRAGDIVARSGGDDFVVVSSGLDGPDAMGRVARQVRDRFNDPVHLDSGEVLLSLSVGVAHAPANGDDVGDRLLAEAEAAMERARRSRIGIAVADQRQREADDRRHDTGERLRGAIEDSDLHVFYQPIVEVDRRRLVAVEALLRWNRPDHGWVTPDQFLSTAAEAGLMASLGELVLREAVHQTHVWATALRWPADASMAVNVSERQLMDTTFPDQVARLLEAERVPSDRLTLEISEEVVVGELAGDLDVLRHLSQLGVRLAIDDFGTGQTSLSWIERLDMVDELKIDRRFVADVEHSSVDAAIIEAIVALARAVELAVVAEGVETTAQYEFLRRLGVDRVQGYLFAPPLRAGDLEAAMLDPVC